MVMPSNFLSNGGRMTYALVAAVVVVFLVLFFVFLPLTDVKTPVLTRCGNGACEEDCFTCPSDCACKPGKICLNDDGKCYPISSDAVEELERFGGGSFIDSWTEDGKLVVHAQSGGKHVLISSGNITEMYPL